ncbi:DNA-binding transcriptional regulator, ArsR family [Modestobacter sp. DSM 44400]|uniref:ArsR/SmtB family transcription factor n=1 Tax=Modestobacter sp. DSM 44400 TaxID=1550230 RepID=UPI0008959F34|nr:metalloregulator ArsR/SmtB family transcription factor [Modestobacter sp. DSM 44400]SDY88562.1 DNA-binding transcriptional regulator, ArsR family [Modestobacter sp. DSM 44400]
MSALPAGAPLAAPGVQAASELLSALAAPLRLAIVVLLDRHGTRCVHQLVDELGTPQPLVSQHLRVLRGAGLVVGERRHREVHYALVDPHVAEIVRAAVEHASHTTPSDTDPSVEGSSDR